MLDSQEVKVLPSPRGQGWIQESPFLCSFQPLGWFPSALHASSLLSLSGILWDLPKQSQVTVKTVVSLIPRLWGEIQSWKLLKLKKNT